MRTHTEAQEQRNVLMVNIKHGKAMADTGCHSPIAGPEWHKKMQEEHDARGWPYHYSDQLTDFTFGPSEPATSKKLWHYHILVFGKPYTIKISEAPVSSPTLIPKEELKMFGIVFE